MPAKPRLKREAARPGSRSKAGRGRTASAPVPGPTPADDQLGAILDNTTAVIYVKDRRGRYLLINRRYERLFNVTRHDVLGKTDRDLFPRPTARALRANDRQVLAANSPLEFEEVVPQADGPHTYISVKFSLRDGAGIPYAVCGISTDITERKRAEQALRETSLELQAANRKLLALREATLSISGNLSLEETLNRIVKVAAELVNARYAALGVPDETGEYLAQFVSTGLTPAQEARISHRPRGLGLLGLVLREGETLRLRDLRQHPRSVGFPPNHPPMTSFLGMPITHKGRRLGNLYLTDKREAAEFTPEDQHLIELLAAHAGIAIENARLYAQAQRLSILEERQRIGMDLHDGIIQSIYAVGLNLEYIHSQLADGEIAEARERLRGAVEALNSTIRDIRAYILDLRPRRFEGDNLILGLERLLAEFKANTLMAVEFAADPVADRTLWPEARLALFLIAQEALSNAAKHSRASRVEVRLLEGGSEVTLTLRDNGRGFQPEQVERRVGHGLMNMADRAATFGGEVVILSPGGQGTEVRVRIPKASPQ